MRTIRSVLRPTAMSWVTIRKRETALDVQPSHQLDDLAARSRSRGRPVGSSAQTIAGSLTSERAIVTRWRSPPESSSGTCDARSASPTRSSASSARRRASPALGPRDEQRQLDVLDRGQHRHQVVELEDEAHAPRAVVGALAVGHLGERRPLDHDLAAVDRVEAGEAVEQRGLAAPARPHDRDHLARARASRSTPRSASTRTAPVSYVFTIDRASTIGLVLMAAPSEARFPLSVQRAGRCAIGASSDRHVW